ncbi:substrate-binding domain-containing protein [Brevundimonas sp.]|uniref:substrate-binding domain-containing protein n=1 Tax=Brevundimonas sp. TaxID=1871086 RepID=UPI002ABB0B9A|nr:substrate-binding domain-containing protein [Brevundimonas sp.]MDZ4362843.1 substrate-binding domain-containing protein [Brevundimonas sp.]
MELTRKAMLSGMLASAVAACARSAPGLKIGFIVKQPEESWFQDEWRFADMAARENGFTVLKIGGTDGDRVLTAIDNLAAKNAAGFIICAPDTRLGPAIEQRARVNDLKVMSVDDRLVDARGKPIESIPHVGISAADIGGLAGRTAVEEAVRRGWPLAETGILRLSFDGLETARERTANGRDAAVAAGVPAGNVHDAPQRTTDTEGGFNAASPVLTRVSTLKRWIVLGMNDEAVLGGVRAAEQLGLPAQDIIGIGIGGSGSAEAEFSKPALTGFYGSILLSPRRHGFDTSLAMYRWVTEGVRPAAVTFTDGLPMDRSNWRALLEAQKA